MASERFACGVHIAAPRARVHAELAEPARQLGLQPLLVEVRALPPPAPGLRAFSAVERIRLVGSLHVRNRIRVELDGRDPARVLFRARAWGGIRVESEFQLAAIGGDAGATRVREQVVVHVPPWLGGLRSFVVRQAASAQARLLQNLKARLEADG